MASVSPASIRQRVAAAINSALGGSGYHQSVWAPPLFPDAPGAQDTRTLAHKGYAVFLSTTSMDTEHRHRPAKGAYAMTMVHVVFGWRLRADAQVADYDAALGAELAVVAAVMGMTQTPSLRPRLVRVAQRAVAPASDGAFYVGRLDFEFRHIYAEA